LQINRLHFIKWFSNWPDFSGLIFAQFDLFDGKIQSCKSSTLQVAKPAHHLPHEKTFAFVGRALGFFEHRRKRSRANFAANKIRTGFSKTSG
jgi:hypothetical protein